MASSATTPIQAMVVFGTRPEAVKVAPVIRALQAAPGFRVTTLVTAQHREMVDQVLTAFQLPVDHDLDLMRPRQTLPELTARVVTRVTEVLQAERPDVVLVQGDTTTVMAAALAAFYEQLPVGHIEAGLRTTERYDPFPEEMNRRLTTRLAGLHFAATDWAVDNLLAEGIDRESIYLTGNPVIDALRQVAQQDLPLPDTLSAAELDGRRLLLVTAHRRENLGAPLARICDALAELVERHDDTLLVYAMHRNPAVREVVEARLGRRERVRLIEPPGYFEWVGLMRRAHLILTDSGGIQEEAPALGIPVLVLRETTERPEGVTAGTARLVGTDREAIVTAAAGLLHEDAAHAAMAQAANPYGDGRAAERIVAALAHVHGQGQRPADFHPSPVGSA